jgi:soluble cytochrome b562
MQQPVTIKQLRARFNKEHPKIIGLKNDQGQWPVATNPPAMKAEVRMKQIEAYLAKESTPDGIYFFIEKEGMKNAPETVTPVAKGDVRNLPALQEPAQKVIVQKVATQDVWDMDTALDKETQIIRLTFRNTYLEEQIAELKSRIRELEEELAQPLEDDDTEKSDTKDMMDGFKSIVETLTPVIDKHFEQKDRELSIKEKMIVSNGSAQRTLRQAAQTADTRTDGGLPCNDPGYEEYFKAVLETGTDAEYDTECNYLESVNPALYEELDEKYNTEEDGSEA